MDNTSKPSTTFANTSKVSFAELWSTITTSYTTETRSWIDCSSIFDNTYISTDTLWSLRSFPWLMTAPWQQIGGITNTSKPA